jgi:hypothetical protein
MQQLNKVQLYHALRAGTPVEVRHHGRRYVLAPQDGHANPDAHCGTALHGFSTNVPAERLPAGMLMEWAARARAARAAFAPVQIIAARPGPFERMVAWRNHRNLQFLTHRLRCLIQREWRAKGETRPVEEVLRDLQEVHRATLTVEGVVVRRLETTPSRAVAALLTKLNLWPLLQGVETVRK